MDLNEFVIKVLSETDAVMLDLDRNESHLSVEFPSGGWLLCNLVEKDGVPRIRLETHFQDNWLFYVNGWSDIWEFIVMKELSKDV